MPTVDFPTISRFHVNYHFPPQNIHPGSIHIPALNHFAWFSKCMFGSEPRQTLPQAPSYLSCYITAARRNSASAETVSGNGLPCFPQSLAWSVRSLCLLSESGCRLRSDCDMKGHFAAREQCTCGSVFPFLAPDYRLAVTGWVRICIKPKPDSSLR